MTCRKQEGGHFNQDAEKKPPLLEPIWLCLTTCISLSQFLAVCSECIIA